MKLDLHIHTTASDGTDSPSEVVRYARQAGFSAIAVTDHDTLGGISEAMAEGERLGMKVIPGCEISAGGISEVHVLGYGLMPGCELESMLSEMRGERQTRMEQMIALLKKADIIVPMELVQSYTHGPVGRAHLARALAELDYVVSIKDAFNKYLAPGGLAYVPRRKVDTRVVIQMIRASGGVPVVAHPGRGCVDTFWLEECLRSWRRRGLMGVEAYHPGHGLSMARALDRMARRNGLLVTGGSDYHGGVKIQKMGDGLTGWRLMDKDYRELSQAIACCARPPYKRTDG